MHFELIENVADGFRQFRFLPSLELIEEVVRRNETLEDVEYSLGISLFNHSFWMVWNVIKNI